MRLNHLSVPCPTCQTPVIMNASSKYRPFCSERCRLIDLGEWASEGHAIPGRPMTEGEDSDDEFWSGHPSD